MDKHLLNEIERVELAYQVRSYQKTSQLSVVELAKSFGVPEQILAKILSQESIPKKCRSAVCRKMGITVRQLRKPPKDTPAFKAIYKLLPYAASDYGMFLEEQSRIIRSLSVAYPLEELHRDIKWLSFLIAYKNRPRPLFRNIFLPSAAPARALTSEQASKSELEQAEQKIREFEAEETPEGPNPGKLP